VYPFSQKHATMCLVAREVRTTKVFVFVKGADSVMQKLLRQGDAKHDQVVKKVFEDVEHFSGQGLRTLVFAYRELDFLSDSGLIHVMKKGWNALRQNQIEKDLTILGATGVEDILQPEVKECVEDFVDAGMRLWMLTGDKGRTGCSIAI